MVRLVVGSIPHDVPTELFFPSSQCSTTNVQRAWYVLFYLCGDRAYKKVAHVVPTAGFPLLLRVVLYVMFHVI